MKTLAQLAWISNAAVLLLAGCPSNSDQSMNEGTGGADSSHEDASMVDDNCGLPPFELNVEATGATLHVKLIDAMPNPPEKFDNDWTVEVTDQDGNPLTSPDDFEVEPWMPAHGHGATHPAVITALDTPGQFLLSPVYLWMGGLWDVRFKSPGQTTPEDWALLHACIKD